MNLSSAIVTFLFTDIEGSTKLWEEHPDQMSAALARHDTLLRKTIEANNGIVFKTMGDAFCAAFATAPDALNAALQAQIHLNHSDTQAGEREKGKGEREKQSGREGEEEKGREDAFAFSLSPFPFSLKVRMALHTGEAEQRDGDFFGQALNRVTRLLSAGSGGQILISASTQELIRDALPPSTTLQDLGVHRLRDLARPEQISQLIHPDLPSDFPPLKSLNARQHNLPNQLTSFIGREKELAEIKQRLAATHLITLTGTGGCGKTRLALQVGLDVLSLYPDGVWLVELAALSDPALPEQNVIRALGLREEPGRSMLDTLLDYLQDKTLLLILDNCEHVIAPAARLTNTLLRACPDLWVLASSREPLGVPGETLYRIPSLAVPVQGSRPIRLSADRLLQYGAVRLFMERATAISPGFSLNPANAAAIVQICQRLDGIPLALELAAARVRSLSVEQIATRLDDRFRLLTGGSRAALPRQQTLRALIDWSYELLTEPERTLLSRLSVFEGGWTLAAAEFVCTSKDEGGRMKDESTSNHPSSFILHPLEVLDLLTSLVDKSLVFYEEPEGQSRYRLLETMRDYAADRLRESGEAAQIGARHLAYFLQLAQQVAAMSPGKEQSSGYALLETEHANLRAALEWSLSEGKREEGRGKSSQAEQSKIENRKSKIAAVLCLALAEFWESQGHFREGREAMERCLAQWPQNTGDRQRARLCIKAGWFAYRQADYPHAIHLQEQSLALYHEVGDVEGEADALNDLALTHQESGRIFDAHALMEQSLQLAEELGDDSKRAGRLSNLGLMAIRMQQFEQAQHYLQQARSLYARLQDRFGEAACLCNLTELALKQQQWQQAKPLAQQSLQIFRDLNERPGMAYALANLAEAGLHLGEWERSGEWAREALAICAEAEMRGLIPPLLDLQARIQAAQGVAQESLFCLVAADKLREKLHLPRSPQEQQEMTEFADGLRNVIDTMSARALHEHIAGLDMEDVIAEIFDRSS